MTLNELAKEYRKTKSSKILEEITNIIMPKLKRKASYIYFIKWNGLLNKSAKVEYSDVEQELYLDTLLMLNSYDINRPFENYYWHSLRYWRPSFINAEFFHNIRYVISGDAIINEEGDSIFSKLENPQSKEIEIANLNDREQFVFEEITINPEVTQEELSRLLKLSQQTISLILKELRKKVKIY